MRETLPKIKRELKQPYFWALLLIACIPIFPEYLSFVLVIVAAALAGRDLRIHKRKLRTGIIGKLLIAFCCYQTISCVYSAHWFSSLSISFMWWLFLLAYLVVANLLTDAHRLQRFLMCITAAAGIVGLIACVQYRVNFFIGRNVGNTWLWLDNIVFKALDGFGIEIFYLDYKLRAFPPFPTPICWHSIWLWPPPLLRATISWSVAPTVRVCLAAPASSSPLPAYYSLNLVADISPLQFWLSH